MGVRSELEVIESIKINYLSIHIPRIARAICTSAIIREPNASVPRCQNDRKKALVSGKLGTSAGFHIIHTGSPLASILDALGISLAGARNLSFGSLVSVSHLGIL